MYITVGQVTGFGQRTCRRQIPIRNLKSRIPNPKSPPPRLSPKGGLGYNPSTDDRGFCYWT